MKQRDAVALIADAVGDAGVVWADLGAGQGTFTQALANLLGPSGHVYALDRDPDAVAALRRLAARASASGLAPISVVRGDFTNQADLASIPESLDGILLANALHFVPDAGAVLARLVRLIRPGGRVLLVEYDQPVANPWVPYPIPIVALDALARAAKLEPFTVAAIRQSLYQERLYAAFASKAG
ncbi:MAG TPA: methyltransferase domain-containing protein [Gemmatimonadaceae bacterium]